MENHTNFAENNGGSTVSYKSEIQANTAEMKRRRKIVFLFVKITSVLLALMLVATSVLVIVDVVGGNVGGRTEQGDSSSSLITPTKGKTVTVYAGDTVAYKSLVQVPAGYELEYTSNADLSVPGKYTVTYTLLKDGKKVETYKLTLVVEERNVELEQLMTIVAQKAETLGITKEMSKVEQVRRIYDFVNSPTKGKADANIYFNDLSNTGNDRTKWEMNWIAEATLTLQRGEGDCYSYYSVSKAFFEYFGIENVGIQRGTKANIDEAGTHFWSIVNVGTAQKPQWYYYDSTRLGNTFPDGTRNACLITLEKLQSYVTTTGHFDFYYFDPAQYPTAETTPLT